MTRPPVTQLAAYEIRELLALPPAERRVQRARRQIRVAERHRCIHAHSGKKPDVALEVIYAGHRLLYLPPTADNHVKAEIDVARYQLEEARQQFKSVDHPDQVRETWTAARRAEQEITQLQGQGLTFGPRAYRLGRPVDGAVKDVHIADGVVTQPCPRCHKRLELHIKDARVVEIAQAPPTSVLDIAARWLTTT